MKTKDITLEKYLSKSRLNLYTKLVRSNELKEVLDAYRLNIRYSEKFYSTLIAFLKITSN